ncbi:adhesion G protein-coupled receptor E3-like [Megalobrama amblycephala]|uniref:adhesion G protein-coupled receptor E3-like n=1 Tax=Megalobrama amblycephala TaxID=75352 RepID=UPI002013FBA1|nr:adhesion G protein-coupled receptor E3-like [Megalobrama amblycephala]
MAFIHKGFIKAQTLISVNQYVLRLILAISTVTPVTTATANLSDPCYNYTVLDNPWRSINNTINNNMCDTSVSWSGWYRLFINGLSAHVADTCVALYRCGTSVTLWIRGGHPTVKDGVVTRDVCGYDVNYCCYHGSYPIKVKACPGNYYVYELVSPNICNAAYCADTGNITTTAVTPVTISPAVTDISAAFTTVTPETTSAGINITLPEGCTSQNCFQNLLEQIENITSSQVLSVTTVTNILTMAFNASEKMLDSSSSSVSPAELASYGNRVLKTSEKLISTLVKPTDTSDNVSLALAAVEVEVFMVGPNVALNKIPRLDTTNSSVDIDLIGIARNNDKGSAAVAFMGYNTMENLLKPDFFNTSNDTVKTMMSTVISATLPKTNNTKLTKPVNFTLKHIREFDPNGSLSCVYWNISEWIVDGCSVLETNSNYTVCSCVHLSTFALIMQTSRPPESDSQLDLLNLVCVIVGLVFFSLALLTFALCQWSPGVNNVARINICISLLLAHLLFLLTQQFLDLIRPQQVLCAVISGVLHFLFLSGFAWMFIEAVLLFICVRNLSQISSKKREVLSTGFLCVIGYTVALVVVAVSVGLLPEGYGSEHCWIKMDKGFIWSFLGPVCVILALNMILFINIIIKLNSTLKNLNAEVSQMKQTKTMTFKTLAQFVVLGCSWILGFFTNGRKELEIIFLILNSQQGTFIFLVYCILNNEVRQQYRNCFRCLCYGRKQH